jgi:hypothetical protein
MKKESRRTGTTQSGRKFFRTGGADRTAGSRGYLSGGCVYGIQ